jgi:MFS family permease
MAATVGLVIGGIFAGWLSWRVGFFINAPIGVALMPAARRYLPETERRSGQLDAAGALSSMLGMAALVFGVVRSADAGWTDALTLAALAAGVLLLALFVVNERRAAQPVMPLRLFSAASEPAPTPPACCSSAPWPVLVVTSPWACVSCSRTRLGGGFTLRRMRAQGRVGGAAIAFACALAVTAAPAHAAGTYTHVVCADAATGRGVDADG